MMDVIWIMDAMNNVWIMDALNIWIMDAVDVNWVYVRLEKFHSIELKILKHEVT